MENKSQDPLDQSPKFQFQFITKCITWKSSSDGQSDTGGYITVTQNKRVLILGPHLDNLNCVAMASSSVTRERLYVD